MMIRSLLEKTLNDLKERLKPNNTLTMMIPGSDNDEFTCEFNSPLISSQLLQEFEEKTKLILPNDFKDFLLIHDGSLLFADPYYGGGVHIMSLEKILDLYIIYTRSELLPKGWYVIGNDDGDHLFVNSNQLNEDGEGDHYLYWSSLIDVDTDPTNLNCNFETWLERMSNNLGRKYWI
ncbi:SMI1/KNR4 family protein [Priestia koreensis]|uniref:SMI1/KNR4 family protein n=1 Tax=Priestia koreensis TaxID=284581 RepID=UPI00345AD4C9